MDNQICFNISHLIFIFVILVIVYFVFKNTSESFSSVNLNSHLNTNELQQKVINLQEELFNCKVSTQNCQRDLLSCQATKTSVSPPTVIVNKTPSMDAPERDYNRNSTFQMIGFLTSTSSVDRYPLFGRTKFPRRSDKWEYYTIDEGRNRIKIVIKTQGDNELYDGDSITVPELGGEFTVKLYEYSNVRYNPDLM